MTPNNAQTLVLNADYTACDVVPWHRAMVLLATNKVAIVHEYQDEHLHVWTPRYRFRIPSVVRLVKYARSKTTAPVTFSRVALLIRDGGRCQYCNTELRINEATIDHVIPASRGGARSWTNSVIACKPCNARKADRTPAEADMPLLTVPKKPAPSPLFRAGLLRRRLPADWVPYCGADAQHSERLAG